MSKIQVIYSHLGVYAGPAPSNSYHFINKSGVLNNDWQNITSGYVLVFPLNRVTAIDYSIELPRTNISFLGDLGAVSRPILDNAEVNLNISYYPMGLINEKRLGLLCNIPSGNSLTGPMIYGTGRVSPISGFYTRNTGRSAETELGWPLITREPRNIFVAVNKSPTDLNDTRTGTTLATIYDNTNIDVYGFGDCFMSSYRCSAGVNELPLVSVGYICNNLELYSSGTDCTLPSINTQNYNTNSGYKFSIPNNFPGTGVPTVVVPSDITISIKQRSNNSATLTDYILDFSDIKIQNFNFDILLPRRPLYGLGYKFPNDRQLQPPIISNLSFSILPGENRASSLVSLIKRDELYDISLKLNYQRRSMFTGVAVQYDFIGAKSNGLTSDASTSQRMNGELSFITELDPLDTTKGLFITGYLGVMNYPYDAVNKRYQPLY